MKLKISVVPFMVLLGCQLAAASALAQESEDKAQVSLSVKVWHSSWATAMPTVYTGVSGTGTPGLSNSLDSVEGGSKTTTFPALAMRKGKYFAAASYARYTADFRTAHSSIIAPNGMNVLTSRSDHVTRKESDIAAGYLVSPNIGFTLGYKYVTENRDTSLGLPGASGVDVDYKARAVLLGALANFPVQGALRAYGQLGYGPGRVKASFSDKSIPNSESNTRYLISEMGLNYALQITDVYVKGASASLGYRSQVVRTKGVAPAYQDARDYRDTKDGIIFSLTVAI